MALLHPERQGGTPPHLLREEHPSLHAHPRDGDGLPRWIRRIASGEAICGTETIQGTILA